MIKIKKTEDIEILREGGKILAQILKELAEEVKEGITLKELNSLAENKINEGGDKSAFLGYKPRGAKRPYPSSLCVSVNDEVVHGISSERDLTIKDGDIVKLDLGLIHKGLITDHAVTVAVGNVKPEYKKIIEITNGCLMAGIKAAKVGGYVGDIGSAIAKYVRKNEGGKKIGVSNDLGQGKYGIIEELCGHGVGYSVHEDPFIPNIAEAGTGPTLKAGMVIAIEPMLTTGSKYIKTDADGYTVRTKDGSIATHAEHTILISDNGPEILTRI